MGQPGRCVKAIPLAFPLATVFVLNTYHDAVAIRRLRATKWPRVGADTAPVPMKPWTL